MEENGRTAAQFAFWISQLSHDKADCCWNSARICLKTHFEASREEDERKQPIAQSGQKAPKTHTHILKHKNALCFLQCFTAAVGHQNNYNTCLRNKIWTFRVKFYAQQNVCVKRLGLFSALKINQIMTRLNVQGSGGLQPLPEHLLQETLWVYYLTASLQSSGIHD